MVRGRELIGRGMSQTRAGGVIGGKHAGEMGPASGNEHKWNQWLLKGMLWLGLDLC